MAVKQQSGDWIESGYLGSGSFGHVILWENKETTEKIAVKICKNALELSEKNKHRWNEEIRILKDIDHQNVIHAFPLPEELKSFVPDILPALCMEYCEGGDLRKTLSSAENCCGLKQTMILKVCGDIAEAIQCLHKLGITHRDLKPENIVISNANDRVIFKVIDLGYAKQLDLSNSPHSVVGTPCYLAPEIATAEKKYSKTVDYWSYGILMYECCTGNRPFPQDLFKSIGEKTPRHISASLEDENDTKPTFCETLPAVNQLNSVLQPKFEKLLRLLLDWCPKKRGRKKNNNGTDLSWFDYVQEILSTKIIDVFCIDSCTRFTYEQTPNMSLSDLTKIIHNDTGIPADHQELFLANGNDLHSLSSLQSNMHDVFVFNKAFKAEEKKMDTCHEQVSCTLTEMLYYPDGFSHHSLRRHVQASKHSVFYVKKQLENNSCLKNGWGALMIRLLNSRHKLNSKNEGLRQAVTKLKLSIDFYKRSLDVDMENYQTFCDKNDESEKLLKPTVESWKGDEELLDEDIILDNADAIFTENSCLQNTIGKMKKHWPVMQTQLRLSKQQAESREKDVLAKYEQMKRQDKSCFKEKIGDMRDIVHKIMQENKKITDAFYLFLRNLIVLRQRLKNINPKLEKFQQNAMKLSNKVEQMQKERQEQLWRLLCTPLMEEKNKMLAIQDRRRQYSRSTSRNIIQQSQALVSRLKKTLQDVKEQHEMFQVQSQSLDWSFCE